MTSQLQRHAPYINLSPSLSAFFFLALQVTFSLFLELQQNAKYVHADCMPRRKSFHLERKRMLSMWMDSRRWEEGSMEAGMTNEDVFKVVFKW